MSSELGPRIAVFLLLFAVGVGLAAAGTAVGIDNPLTDKESDTKFTVVGEGVYVSDNEQETQIVENLSQTSHVEISVTDSGYTVDIEERGGQLSAEQRERAATIARNNETISAYIDSVEEYNLSVEPIEKLDGDDLQQVNLNTTNETRTGNGTIRFTVTNEGDNSVRIDREPTYVDNQATVRLYGPDEELRYSVHVDLQMEAIVRLTDWEQIG